MVVRVLRRTLAGAAALALLVGLSSCGGGAGPSRPLASATSQPPAPPLAVASSEDAKPAVQDGHLTRALVLDGGALRLDPTDAPPRTTEQQAVRLWAAGAAPGGSVDTEAAVVALARVTLRTPISVGDLELRPAALPSFVGRDAWVILWQNGGHSCPAITGPGPGGPEPQPVEMIAADGSGTGVMYGTRGSFCAGPVSGPTATVATYQESLPWTVANSTPASLTLAFTIPACAEQSGLAGPDGTTYTIWVGATVVMGARPCTGGKPGDTTDTVGRPSGTPTHGATGVLVSRFTGDPTTLHYFDGADRTLPVSQ